MSDKPGPARRDVKDVEEDFDELSIRPTTPEEEALIVRSRERNHDFAYGVRPLITPPRRGLSRRHDDFDDDNRGGYYASRPMHRLPQTPRSRPPTRDAQSEHPASACVFVANLPQGCPDFKLESALHTAFSDYGRVFIKVRRDGNNMPFAFAQFTNDEDAQNALRHGRDRIIEGRPCRVEPPRAAQLSYYIIRRDGNDMTKEEAVETMGELDRISLVSILNERRSQALGALGRSFSVQYERWNASRDVVGFFRDHPVYRIDTLTDIPPSRVSRPAPRYNNNRSPPAYNDNRSPHHGRPTYTAEGDNRSIWISNLEADVTDEELDHLVSHLGRVVSYRIGVSRLPTQGRTSNGLQLKAWAIVEFETLEQANNAIRQLNGANGPNGEPLNVERKIGKNRNAISQGDIRQRFIQDGRADTPRYDEGERASRRQLTDRPHNDRSRRQLQDESPTRPIRSAQETSAASTTPASYMPGPAPSISDFTPAPSFPTMPTVPYQGPYMQPPGFAPGYQFPMGMPMGGMGYFGGPAHYGPVYHTPGPYDPMNAFQTFTAPPAFVVGGGFAPSDPFQGPAARSEPTGGKEEEKEGEEEE